MGFIFSNTFHSPHTVTNLIVFGGTIMENPHEISRNKQGGPAQVPTKQAEKMHVLFWQSNIENHEHECFFLKINDKNMGKPSKI